MILSITSNLNISWWKDSIVYISIIIFLILHWSFGFFRLIKCGYVRIWSGNKSALECPASLSSTIKLDELDYLENVFGTRMPGKWRSGIESNDTLAFFTVLIFEKYPSLSSNRSNSGICDFWIHTTTIVHQKASLLYNHSTNPSIIYKIWNNIFVSPMIFLDFQKQS